MSTAYRFETADSDRVPATTTLPALRTVKLLRTPKPAPRPNPDALPFRADFVPALTPALVPPDPQPWKPQVAPRRVPKHQPVGRTVEPAIHTAVPGGVTFVCAHCSKVVFLEGKGAQGRHRYCNADCRSKAHVRMRTARNRQEAIGTVRRCEACGEPLQPLPGHAVVPSNKRYCRKKCAAAVSWQRRQASKVASDAP